jgi:hypothetical protein
LQFVHLLEWISLLVLYGDLSSEQPIHENSIPSPTKKGENNLTATTPKQNRYRNTIKPIISNYHTTNNHRKEAKIM